MNPAFLLRERHLKKLGGKRPQDESRKTALGGHNGKGLEVLGHGPLPKNFAGNDEVRSFLFEHLAGFAKHEGMTVDTGIHVPAVTVGRVSDHFEVGFGQVNDFEGKLNGLCRYLRPMGREKGCFEEKAEDIDPLGPDDL